MNKISIQQGDITAMETEAIVNAANQFLAPGGGVAGAIHDAGGPGLTRECQSLGGCNTGEAKITNGHNLPAPYVIHTVGPAYGQEGGKEEELLRSCYKESLKLAEEYGLKSIAFPGVSTGAFGYPKKEAFRIGLETVKDYLENNDSSVKKVIFVAFTSEDEEIYNNILAEIT